jgi:hypothetical protein
VQGPDFWPTPFTFTSWHLPGKKNENYEKPINASEHKVRALSQHRVINLGQVFIKHHSPTDLYWTLIFSNHLLMGESKCYTKCHLRNTESTVSPVSCNFALCSQHINLFFIQTEHIFVMSLDCYWYVSLLCSSCLGSTVTPPSHLSNTSGSEFNAIQINITHDFYYTEPPGLESLSIPYCLPFHKSKRIIWIVYKTMLR